MDDLKLFEDLEEVDPLAGAVAARSPSSRSTAAAGPGAIQNAFVALLAIGAGVGVVVAGCAPTGWLPADVIFSFLAGLLVTIATARARRWTWFVLVGLAALGAQGSVLLAMAVIAVALAMVGVAVHRSKARLVGAAVGALSAQILARLPEYGFNGSSVIWAGVAVAPVLISGYRRSRLPTRRAIRLSALALGAVAVFATVGFGISAITARATMTAGGDQARLGFDAARAGRQDDAVRAFREADSSFSEGELALTAPWARPARILPVIGSQAMAAEAMARSGRELSHAAAEAAGSARYDELRTTGGHVDLQRLRAMQQPVRDARDALDRARGRLGEATSPWLLPQLADPLAELQREVDRSLVDADLAADAIDVAPSMLGGEGPRRYLILFANTAESRYLGGFVAAYGELTAIDGKVTMTRSGRIAELSDSPGFESRTLAGPQEFLDRYGRLFPQRFLQNLSASPDFEADAAVARELYPKAGGQPIDGVIYVDPFGLAALLKITGPVQVQGSTQPLTADNAPMFLLRDQYVTLPDPDDRTDLLASASRATFDALTSRELPGPRALADALGPAVREGRLHMVTFDEAGRALLDRLGAVRSFPHGSPELGDFFSVRSSNSNPNKIDSFLHRDVTFEATVDSSTGQVNATATIIFRNDAPGAMLPDYIIGSEGNRGPTPAPPAGTNAMFVSVYSSLELDRATYDGSDLPVAAQTEAGHRVYSALIQVPARSSGQLVLTLRGAMGEVQAGPDQVGRYRLTVAPQPMVNPDQMHLAVRPAGDQRLVHATGMTAAGGVAEHYAATEQRTLEVEVGPP